MARRTPYTKVERKNFSRPAHVEGQGDVLYRGFQCLNPECTNFIFIKDEGITDDFEIVCDACGFKHTTGETTRVYDYDLRDKRDNSIIESGAFEVLHDDYIAEAKAYKYCIICATLKPIELFDKHAARKTGRQGECKLASGSIIRSRIKHGSPTNIAKLVRNADYIPNSLIARASISLPFTTSLATPALSAAAAWVGIERAGRPSYVATSTIPCQRNFFGHSRPTMPPCFVKTTTRTNRKPGRGDTIRTKS